MIKITYAKGKSPGELAQAAYKLSDGQYTVAQIVKHYGKYLGPNENRLGFWKDGLPSNSFIKRLCENGSVTIDGIKRFDRDEIINYSGQHVKIAGRSLW